MKHTDLTKLMQMMDERENVRGGKKLPNAREVWYYENEAS